MNDFLSITSVAEYDFKFVSKYVSTALTLYNVDDPSLYPKY